MLHRVSLIPLLLLLLVLPACGESAEARAVHKQLQEALDATKNLVVATWADLQKKAEPQLQQAEARLAELRASLADHSEAARKKAEAALRDAELRLTEAKQKLSGARDAGKDSAAAAWQDIKSGLDHASTALDQAWQELKKK